MLLKISKFFLYASVFSVVVIVTTSFFPFIGGKYYFFRVAIECSLAAFMLWWAFEAPAGAAERMIEIWKRPLIIAVSIFVLAFLLASVFAFDSHAAFWSNYERGEGGFQMIHYYIFFLLLTALFRTKEDWRKLFLVSLAAAVLMVLYGVMSAAIPDAPLALPSPFNIFFIGPYLVNGHPTAATFWARLFSNVRFEGSLGNPAYVAPYLMFSMFYALWLWLSKERTAGSTLSYLGLIAFFFIFFWLSGTRGTFLGLGVAALFYLLYLAFRDAALRRWAASAFIALIVLGSTLVVFRNSPFIKSLPGARVFEISTSDQTVQTRLWTWGSAWHGFLDSPKTFLVGWGPENFTTVFDKYFNPNHFVPGQQSETWFDRAHSIVFDYLAETGIIGFLAYVSMFLVFYWEFITHIWPSSREHLADKKVFLHALLFVVPAGYLVQGLALFDVLPIYINVFAFLAFASYLLYRAPQELGGAKKIEHKQ